MSWVPKNPPDFSRHNAEVAAVWDAYHQGQPTRVPVSVHGSIRNLIQNPDLNTTGYTFEDFFTDPEAQIQCQLSYQKWCRYHLLCDTEMGPPKDAWSLSVDFQNSYDAGWFGCPLHYDGNAVPDTTEILKEDKHRLHDMSCPDLLHGGLMGRALEFHEYMHERCRNLEFEGLPVRPPRTIPSEGCDGPLDAAYKLRGAGEVCMDMLAEPEYYHDLMEFVTDCLIRISGGPSVMLIKDGEISAIGDEVRDICESGIMEGGKFILIAANNMAPCTPVEHVVALYDAAKRFGRYDV